MSDFGIYSGKCVPYKFTIPLPLRININPKKKKTGKMKHGPKIVLGNLETSFQNLHYDKTKILVYSEAISIFFRIPEDNYFMSCVIRNGGFTFENLIKAIYVVGIKAISWDIENHPDHYKDQTQKVFPNEIINKYSVKLDDIRLTGNCIYVINTIHDV